MKWKTLLAGGACAALIGVGLATVPVGPTAAAGPVQQPEEATSAASTSTGTVAAAREYLVTYRNYLVDLTPKTIRLPAVPVGMSYRKGAFFTDKNNGLWGVLLRSDRSLVGVTEHGREQVAAFNLRHPGRLVVDMATTDEANDGYTRRPGQTVLFSDGSLGSLDAGRDQALSRGVYPSGPDRYTRFISESEGLFMGTSAGDVVYLPNTYKFDWSLSDWVERPWLPSDKGVWDVFQKGSTKRVEVFDNDRLAGERGSCVLGKSTRGHRKMTAALILTSGRVTCVPDGDPTKARTGGWEKPSADPNRPKNPHDLVPKLARGKRYLDVASMGDYVMFLRSDSVLVYRGDLRGIEKLNQPPKLPAGLKYVAFHPWGLLRSDGQVVWMPFPDGFILDKHVPKGTPKASAAVDDRGNWPKKGWRNLSGYDFTLGYQPLHDQPDSDWLTWSVDQFTVAERVRPGGNFPSGIRVVAKAGPVKRGTTAKVTVEIATSALRSGGEVVVKTQTGRVLGRTTINKSARVAVEIKTKGLRIGPHVLRCQYLGNIFTRASGKSSFKLLVTP
ncbi:MAG: hypothetical protein FWD59_09555 [Micrococcales bacterium]|nr:hypothetical protein [Micrococcales bacterium]